MVNICWRVCGKELEIMAVCITCNREISYGCLRCEVFSDTRIHVDCLRPVSSVTHGKYAYHYFMYLMNS
jgi:hypothetical protein